MSRSYKKPYGLIDNRSKKRQLKRFWNKKVRRSSDFSNGNFYKKICFDREYENHYFFSRELTEKERRRK